MGKLNILVVSLSLPSLPTSSGSELQNSQIIYFLHNPPHIKKYMTIVHLTSDNFFRIDVKSLDHRVLMNRGDVFDTSI